MVSEVIGGARVVVVGRVVNILAVCLLVGVDVRVELGIVREEQTVPGAILFVLSVLLVAEGLIVSLQGGALGHIHRLSGDHGREGSQIRA